MTEINRGLHDFREFHEFVDCHYNGMGVLTVSELKKKAGKLTQTKYSSVAMAHYAVSVLSDSIADYILDRYGVAD